VARGKLADGERKNASESQPLLGKSRGVSVQFDPADGVARVPRGYKKVSRAAADVQEFALCGGVAIRKKILMSWLERHEDSIARGVHSLVPEGVGHFAWTPELNIAVRTVEETVAGELLDAREVTQPAASGAKRGDFGLRRGWGEWNAGRSLFAELLAGLHRGCGAARLAREGANLTSTLALRVCLIRGRVPQGAFESGAKYDMVVRVIGGNFAEPSSTNNTNVLVQSHASICLQELTNRVAKNNAASKAVIVKTKCARFFRWDVTSTGCGRQGPQHLRKSRDRC
jgi:hypothetical protein